MSVSILIGVIGFSISFNRLSLWGFVGWYTGCRGLNNISVKPSEVWLNLLYQICLGCFFGQVFDNGFWHSKYTLAGSTGTKNTLLQDLLGQKV